MSEKKIIKFDLSSDNIKIRTMLNNDFLFIHINAVSSALPNENNSNFNKESQEISLPSWDNKPILGYFGSTTLDVLMNREPDFQAHNGGDLAYDEELDNYYYDYSHDTDEKAIGFIVPGSAKVVYHEDDGLWWTECDAILWCKYNYKSIKNLLKSRRKTVSVEVEIIKSHFDENEYEIYEEFSLMGCTILSDRVLPGIKNAHLTVSSFSKTEKFQKQMKVLNFAYKKQTESINGNSNNINPNISQDANQLRTTKETFEDENIYHTNNPQQPENENWEEITFIDEGNNSEVNKENESKEVSGVRKESMSSMTYNAKRQILESALNEAVKNSYTDTSKIYSWVNDFSENDVFFYLDTGDGDEGYYGAPYTLTLTTEDGVDKVDTCTVDFANRERVTQTWVKYSQEDGNPETFEQKDDRANEAPKTGSEDTAHPASKSGDDRGVPHPPATYENSEGDGEGCACESKECEGVACEEKVCESNEKSEDENASKAEEAKENTEVKSTSAGGEKEVTEVVSNSCEEKVDACNYEAKFAQLSSDYLTMQKENENLKSTNAKFEADLEELNKKLQVYESEKLEATRTNLYNFGMNIINAETDIDAKVKETMSAELKAQCDADKFSSEDEVKTFAITSLAVALYEARKAKKEEQAKAKNEFIQNIVKPDTEVVNNLVSKRNALEAI